MKSWSWSLVCVIGLAGCAGRDTDDTFFLTGTEEHAVRTVDGELVCEAPEKVLICHIPPGNPDNAHTICVSEHAVETHQQHHGDLLGACEGDGGGGDVDAGDDGDGDDVDAAVEVDVDAGEPPVPDVE